MKLWTWALLGGGALLLLSRSKQGQAVVKMSGDVLETAFASLRSFLGAHGIEEAVAKAIMQVEAGGRTGFTPEGKVLIRFEPHVFKGRAKVAADRVPLLPGMAAPTLAEGYKRRGGQAAEWEALGRAAAINAEAAYASTSYGPFQVMGFNFKDSGFGSATEMHQALSADPLAAYSSWMKFIANSGKGLFLRHMKEKNWAAFARAYNGDKTGKYAARMAAAYRKLVG